MKDNYVVGDVMVTWLAKNPPIVFGLAADGISRTNEPPHVIKAVWRVISPDGRMELRDSRKYRIVWIWDRTRDVWTWRFATRKEVNSGFVPVMDYADSVIDETDAVEIPEAQP